MILESNVIKAYASIPAATGTGSKLFLLVCSDKFLLSQKYAYRDDFKT
jgi:hypothetical protein